jgi:hypothetical protein
VSLISLQGDPVLSGTVTRPLTGAWTATLEVETAVEPLGAMTLDLAGTSLVGTIVRASVFRERVECVLVGGAGGLADVLPAKFYRGVTLRTILVDTLLSAGERFAATSDTSVTGTAVPAWIRPLGTTSQALNALVAKVPGSTWRVLADGSVWVGITAWATKSLEYVPIDENGVDQRTTIATEDLSLDAGVTLDGRRVNYVRHSISSSSVRTEVWHVPS